MVNKIKALIRKFTQNKYRRKFDYLLNKKDFSKNDKQLNLMILRYLIHQLDKTIKYRLNKGNIRGENKYKKAKKIIKILEENGQINEDELSWSKKILKKYEHWIKTRERAIIKGSKSIESADLISIIKNRRSIRFWVKTDISEKEIYKILEPAIYAPSSCNRQPWQFIVVKNINSTFDNPSNKSMLKTAPYIIYIAIDRRFHHEKYAPAIDVGIVAQNILLSLEYYGYSSCPVYQYEGANQKKLSSDFGLSKYQKIYLAIAFGKGNEIVEMPARTSIKNIVKFV